MVLSDLHKSWGIIKNTHMKKWTHILWFHIQFFISANLALSIKSFYNLW